MPMQLRVYYWELFVRKTLRYIVAGVLFVIVVLLALVWGNILEGRDNMKFTWQSGFGALLLIGLGRGYWIWAHRIDQEVVTMNLGDAWLTIGDRTLSWNVLMGFGLEINKNTQALHNLILLSTRGNEVHTFADEQENIQAFIKELVVRVPFNETFQLTRSERFMRGLKL